MQRILSGTEEHNFRGSMAAVLNNPGHSTGEAHMLQDNVCNTHYKGDDFGEEQRAS